MRSYVIGDIHGHLDLLKAVHARIARDDAAHGGGGQIVHVGDLIDRGPDSRGVVEYLMRGQMDGRPWIVLKGNHDRFLSRFLADPGWIDQGLASRRHWLDHPNLGAAQTLASYGVDLAGRSHAELHEALLRAVPPAHADWLDRLPLWHALPEAIIVHAGIRPGIPIERQAEDDLVWIRHGFLDDRTDHGKLIVHGHTVVDQVTHFSNRLAVDTGAAYGRDLSAVLFEDGNIHLLTDQGREAICHADGAW
ncbi:metallophosphoesterase [Paracoccus ravus]|uniref:metallophosphoesterase n=1 Tax=Paracoccus ravus TaxID=2447760 RepID=UPI00106DDBE9|nr:metallophosphoesterase [Paracoccus ravus]